MIWHLRRSIVIDNFRFAIRINTRYYRLILFFFDSNGFIGTTDTMGATPKHKNCHLFRFRCVGIVGIFRYNLQNDQSDNANYENYCSGFHHHFLLLLKLLKQMIPVDLRSKFYDSSVPNTAKKHFA